jgi:hypothetical protein
MRKKTAEVSSILSLGDKNRVVCVCVYVHIHSNLAIVKVLLTSAEILVSQELKFVGGDY